MKVLFLDVDGVLNDHDYNRIAESATIKRECVNALNRVLLATGCKIVLSSAWRYIVHGGAMTLLGFEYMLRTHGVACAGRIVGLTCEDESAECCDRGEQIRLWVKENFAERQIERYAVVDDDDFEITPYGHPLVRTHGHKGLTETDADRLIELLGMENANDKVAVTNDVASLHDRY